MAGMSANSFGARGRLTVGETNCITPVIEIAHRRVGVERAIMTTVHAYAAGQNLIDAPSREFRRGRSGAANLVPTSTGAARDTTRAHELVDKFHSIAVRAPIPSDRSPTSCVDLTLTRVVDSTLVKVMAWYDNEWGFTNR